jgi:hypothetical protein
MNVAIDEPGHEKLSRSVDLFACVRRRGPNGGDFVSDDSDAEESFSHRRTVEQADVVY